MYTILIVEDDAAIAGVMREHLERWGFSVVLAEDFQHVLDTFRRVKPHLTILDISLPFFNGYYWCMEIRKESQVPVLFLSSHAENADVVMAVNMGGDDYVIKPFAMEVLVAKINAMMRRAYSYFTEAQTLAAGGALLSVGEGALTYQGVRVDLTRNENRILTMLLENKNQIVSRDAIMKHLWDDENFVDDNTLTVNVNRLRRKLACAGLTDFVETKKGEGYIVHG